jgi:glucosyl-3-phosphoglycerate synthase
VSNLTSIHHSRYSVSQLARDRERSVTVCVPTRNEATSIGPIVETLVTMRRHGAIDQVLVADDSTDRTALIATNAGAEVIRQADLRPELGPVLGKGDGMWRALGACDGDVVCFVDGDTADFGQRIPCGLIGAVAIDGYRFAKATYRRPFREGGRQSPTGGGRVTQLAARPLLARLFPELTAFSQPLAGEICADVELLRQLSWSTGYSVDVGLLIDVWRAVGLGAMIEVDLDTRQNRHRPVDELAGTAAAVVDAILDRAREGDVLGAAPKLTRERPPWVSVESSVRLTDSVR